MVFVITLVNIFIGPATLEEIPEDYVPKEWEYLQVKRVSDEIANVRQLH